MTCSSHMSRRCASLLSSTCVVLDTLGPTARRATCDYVVSLPVLLSIKILGNGVFSLTNPPSFFASSTTSMATHVFHRAVLWSLLHPRPSRPTTKLTHCTTGGTTFFPIYLDQGPLEMPQRVTTLGCLQITGFRKSLRCGPYLHNICSTVRLALQPHRNRHDGAPVNATSLPVSFTVP